MNIRIQTNHNKPIYEQIYDQILKSIVRGDLSTDSQLPSIRALAKEVKVSVITIKKAYDDLERDGYIYPIPSKGYYVKNQDQKALKAFYLKEIDNHLMSIRSIAETMGLSDIELLEYISKKLG